MVVAGKIFRLSEPMSLVEVAAKLRGYHRDEVFEEGDNSFHLLTDISGLTSKDKTVTGVYSHDYIKHLFYRGKQTPFPRTTEALFSLAETAVATFLVVVEKKNMANLVANKLSEIIFDKVGAILQVKIPPKTLKEFHRKNPEDTKITFFDNVDIPNVNKLSLYGPDLINTPLFENYLSHGDLWYVVARSKETGYVVGITRDASVTIFNMADKEKFVDYVKTELYPIIIASKK